MFFHLAVAIQLTITAILLSRTYSSCSLAMNLFEFIQMCFDKTNKFIDQLLVGVGDMVGVDVTVDSGRTIQDFFGRRMFSWQQVHAISPIFQILCKKETIDTQICG